MKDACYRFVLPMCQRNADGTADKYFAQKQASETVLGVLANVIQMKVVLGYEKWGMNVLEPPSVSSWAGACVNLLGRHEHFNLAWLPGGGTI